MNKKRFIGLVVLMGISLLGIVAVQYYWFHSAAKVRNELFDRSVNEALTSASKRLQTMQDYPIVNQYFFNDSLQWTPDPPPPPPPLPKHKIHARGTTSYRIKIEPKMNKIENEIQVFTSKRDSIITLHKTHVNDSLIQFITQKKIEKSIQDSNLARIIVKDSMILRPEFEKRIEDKAKQLKDLAKQMVVEIKDWHAGRDLDMKQIHHVLKEEFERKDIPIDFHFTVLANDSVIGGDLPENVIPENAQTYQTGLFPYDVFRQNLKLTVFFPDKDSFVGRNMFWLLGLSLLFTIVILLTFTLSILFILRQKKISEMKSDFINNMTHEFKTPIATIGVAADSIVNEKVISDEEKLRYFAGMIKKENRRMNSQVEKILQIARMDRNNGDYHFEAVNAHELIEKAIQSISLQIEKRKGQIDTYLKASNPVVVTDATHFTNVIYNLLDNAVKYSSDKPEIVLRTSSVSKGISITVEDHGIGMNRAVQAKIFERFYRQPTGNIHNTKGFGLGLSYVKAVVDANKGTITVHSEAGKGSRFVIFIPYTLENG
ncbi:sensor histidine kinase [Prolixibacter denitrificans]|uniref:histidine kinase n=1 Tax=Prolixibacter denitrificans TaxID=1541063 RepID=A0A2P8CIJ6_9BACT|nr:HAMP domain-containing sensor histidine kinase [Prolixibacter denitrificans]PSK84791.1 two-component system phosphate regulon sensor histidine kinase PhoR [Prolixibacter denitrificans]GET20956.1 two-component sensor histidine kinase [Prolixibacter denitrificans]